MREFTIEDFVDVLIDPSTPIKYSDLVQVSNLSNDETRQFISRWTSVPIDRKLSFLEKLTELTEDNVELDFNKVFLCCLNDSHETVRKIAIEGLWESEERTLIKPLLSLLRRDPSIEVRIAAGHSLERFTIMAQIGNLTSVDSARILETLVSVINDPVEETEVKRRAVEVVANFTSPTITKIISVAYKSTNPKLIQSAIYAMGQNADPQWINPLLAEIENEDVAIRYEAVSALGKLGSESSVPKIAHALHDDDFQVQISAIQALGNIGGPRAYQVLQNIDGNGDEAIKDAVKEALNNIEFGSDPLRLRFDT